MKALILFIALTFSDRCVAVVWNPLPPEAYKFGEKYPDAQKLLYAFDYGHALVYEKLLNSDGNLGDKKLFEKKLLVEIIQILKNPPNIKVEEDDIAPQYVFTFPMTVNLFDWSHLLHQFVLDILATSSDRGEGMYKRINEIFDQYKNDSNGKLRPYAITDVCKTMLFMDGHYFSKTFRNKDNFPSFNLLIWSYHWFQIRLYEALLKTTERDRDEAVAKTVKVFWELLSDLPDSAEFDMMPETKKEAPTFGRLFPNIAAAFDNNHMLHDIVSDILTYRFQAADGGTPLVGAEKRKIMREEGLRTARMALDPNAFRSNLCVGN